MTYAKNLFEGVPKKHANKSRFNLSHEWKAGINMGKIIPILCEPTMPGDEFDIPSIEFMFRCAPLYYPIMQMSNMYCNLFWVPNRILWRTTNHREDAWDGWTGFITLTTELEHPTVVIDNQLKTNASENDTVMGFMGIPYWKEAVDWVDTISNVNALPLSAYLAIWDEYYRNPQIEPGRWFNLQDGDNNTTEFNLAFGAEDANVTNGRYRCFSSKWEKDYFTSALPTPQAGDPVQIPLMADYASGFPMSETANPQRWLKRSSGTIGDPGEGIAITTTGNSEESGGQEDVILDIQQNAPDIRELRLAEALQTFKERILKVGQRYTDYIKGLFGNHPTPGSVDVPVWFGYYRGKIQISDVVQQSTTMVDTTEYKTGQYVGRADLYEKSQSFNVFCSEHGWILGLMEIKPNTVYGQGIPRWFRYQLPTDYPLDIFSGIGDQEILKEEVAFTGFTTLASKNQETFGYIPRYSEMRYRNSRWVGNMGNEFGKSQHLGRIWADEALDSSTEYDEIEINSSFINMWSPVTTDQRPQFGGLREVDAFTVLPLLNNSTSENTIWAHIYISMFVNRNLPMFSTPKLGV